MATKSNIVKNRIDIVYFFDVADGNPNGDPDSANLPRTDDETGHGLVTDVCVKRKIRDIMPFLSSGEGSAIFITTEEAPDADRILNNQIERACQESPENPRAFMCKQFRDVRTFGAVMSTGKGDKNSDDRTRPHNAGKVTGPVQISFARSMDPVYVADHGITRKCVASADEAADQIRKNNSITGTMGRKSTIPYGLYRQMAWVSPGWAAKTGFTTDDLSVFLKALVLCFGNDRSAARGHQSFRGAYVFVHDSPLGAAHDYELFDLIKVNKKVETPRAFSDYTFEVDESVPKGVKMFRLMRPDDVDDLSKVLHK